MPRQERRLGIGQIIKAVKGQARKQIGLGFEMTVRRAMTDIQVTTNGIKVQVLVAILLNVGHGMLNNGAFKLTVCNCV